MNKKDFETQENFLRNLAKAYTDYDISLIKDDIAEDIKYNSMWVLQELTNKEEYLDYLSGKLATLKKSNIKNSFMLFYQRGSNMPMLMCSQKTPEGGYAVFIAKNNETGKIKELSIMAADFFSFYYKNEDKAEFEQFQRITGINVTKEDDLTSLLFTKLMDKESPEIIKILLKNGADINAKIVVGLKPHTPLMTAIAFYFNNAADLIKLLIEFGADINARNEYGSTPLIFAVVQRNIEAIRILVKLGADINAKNEKGNTALICATITNAPYEIIKTLVELGADVTVKNNEEKTALDYTRDSVIKEVLKKDTDKLKNSIH